jgi:hypothetical protein
MPRLATFQYYDLRHQCITEMLEAGIPEGVVREVGHVDPAMTSPQDSGRRAAVEALMTVKPGQLEARYVTNYVTNQLPAGNGNS